MREIKFKAYNKATHKMMYWDFISKVRNLQKLMCLNHVEVMQFTGLYDCNYNEIYEGDTLVDLDVELEEGVKIEDTQQQVYWCNKDGAWKLDNTYLQNKKDGWLLAKDLKDFRFKVFGNIHLTTDSGGMVDAMINQDVHRF